MFWMFIWGFKEVWWFWCVEEILEYIRKVGFIFDLECIELVVDCWWLIGVDGEVDCVLVGINFKFIDDVN